MVVRIVSREHAHLRHRQREEPTMKATRRQALAVAPGLALGLASTLSAPSVWAQTTPILEGARDTRIGKLEFQMGLPTEKTVAELYDEMDFQRACQAFLWALPIVQIGEWQRAHELVFG